ncbi:MAG: AmmeMemoRadiSam system protein B [Anaerolineae bacterium]|nr:AmmeMemoRadiSam system protein B [Anaerolineales bacterium]MCQ3977760.1 AmmeMemoRadiSam system protein B [Anaerolineae bacterium]
MSNIPSAVRPPRFADDRWYSSDGNQLREEIQTYFTGAPASPAGLMGLIAPHAGYFFSGHVAGAAFAGLTPGAFDTVILIGPDHRGAALGSIATPNAAVWRTPLGDIPVDWDMLQVLHAEIGLTFLPSDEEHSLEVELPFLQMALERFQLIPLMMGDQSPAICRRLGEALVKTLAPPPEGEAGGERRVLFVASSDLSHYFDDDTARRLDQTTLQFILKLDAAGLLEHVTQGRRQGQPLACGAGPIAVVIQAAAALGATEATLLKYATSADAHPHRDRVVGYAAVAISKSAAKE